MGKFIGQFFLMTGGFFGTWFLLSQIPFITDEKLEEMTPTRLAKTHLPYRVVSHWVEEDLTKTVVCLRNPKDALVSYYHFHQTNQCKLST